MDLANGIVTIKGYDITPETTGEKIKESIADYDDIIETDYVDMITFSDITVDGLNCNTVMIEFYENKLFLIRMYPKIENGDEMDEDMYNIACKKVNDEWLKKELGEPDADDGTTTKYKFSWGDIMTSSRADTDDDIEIRFF